jgi:hypothetical protein
VPRDPFFSQATIERLSTVLGRARARYQRGSDAVPTRYRRSGDAILLSYHGGFEAVLGLYLGGTMGARGYRGVLGGTDGVLGPRRGSEVRLRARATKQLCVGAFICVFEFICVRARLRACMRACVSACACFRAFPSECIFRARVCSELCVRAPRGCMRPPIARRRRAVSIARPAPRFVAARAWFLSVPPAGLARVGPQVSAGRAARPTRDGPRDIRTRRWSTPPAPSTSSAATAATTTPTCTTCGRAPTEVRGRTASRGGWSGGYTGYFGWVLRGYLGVLRGY